MMHDFSQLQGLLASVGILVKKNAEIKTLLGVDFNVFRIVGIDWKELAHSAFLANLLDPKGTHRLGKKFLQAFLDQIGRSEWGQLCETAAVRTEQWTDKDGRLDIVIQNDSPPWSVVIENKILAAEQEDQIARYQSWLDSQGGGSGKLLLYLTLDGHEPTTKSNEIAIKVECISYQEHILRWLETCIELASEHPFVRETLRQYANTIKQITGQTMDNEKAAELIDLTTRDSSTLRGVAELFRHRPAILNTLANQFAEAVKQIASSENWNTFLVNPDPYWRKEDFISIVHKTGVKIRIAPEKTGMLQCFIGIACEDVPPEYAVALRKELSQLSSWQNTQSWLGWIYFPDRNWDEEFFADYKDGDKRQILRWIRDQLELIDAVLHRAVGEGC